MDRGGIIYWRDRAAIAICWSMTLLQTGSAGLWLAFALTVSSMLAIDLGVLQRRPRAPTMVESLAWSAVWVVLAALFGLVVTLRLGPALGAQFFTAYVVEKALSVDNLFVLVLVFGHFGIPEGAQRKVLMSGVVGAVVLRTTLLVLGAAIVARFHPVTYAIGALLVVTAVKVLRDRGDDGALAPASPSDPAAPATPRGDGLVVRIVRRIVPVAPSLDGARFFTRRHGALLATPLLLALVAVEAADIVFAFDSIPAVLGVTTSPMIALTSNVFAILGLRSLYFILAGALARVRHLKTGVGLVLLFVGLKMAVSFAIDVSAGVSLLVIAGILAGATIASLRPSSKPVPEKEV
jgi:tellurite resistance protein TerC